MARETIAALALRGELAGVRLRRRFGSPWWRRNQWIRFRSASLLDQTAARALITRAAQQARLVVVYMHAGAEGSDADHVTGRDEPYLGEDRVAMSAILRVRLSSSGRLEQARLYPTQFSGQGRPVPGGGAIAFTARLSAEDFGASAARIRPSGVIQAP